MSTPPFGRARRTSATRIVTRAEGRRLQAARRDREREQQQQQQDGATCGTAMPPRNATPDLRPLHQIVGDHRMTTFRSTGHHDLAPDGLCGLIGSVVCAHLCVDYIEVFIGNRGRGDHGPCKPRRHVRARQITFWLCRQLRRHLQPSFPEIAAKFGVNNHSTIVAACKVCERAVGQNSTAYLRTCDFGSGQGGGVPIRETLTHLMRVLTTRTYELLEHPFDRRGPIFTPWQSGDDRMSGQTFDQRVPEVDHAGGAE